MNDQLSSSGMAGGITVLPGTPATSGPAGTFSNPQAIPFGVVMEQHVEGVMPPDSESGGGSLPQAGEGLPIGGVAEPELADVGLEGAPGADVLVVEEMPVEAVTAEVVSSEFVVDQAAIVPPLMAQGVVIKEQWAGIEPPKVSMPLEASAVVSLVHDVLSAEVMPSNPELISSMRVTEPVASAPESERIASVLESEEGLSRQFADSEFVTPVSSLDASAGFADMQNSAGNFASAESLSLVGGDHSIATVGVVGSSVISSGRSETSPGMGLGLLQSGEVVEEQVVVDRQILKALEAGGAKESNVHIQAGAGAQRFVDGEVAKAQAQAAGFVSVPEGVVDGDAELLSQQGLRMRGDGLKSDAQSWVAGPNLNMHSGGQTSQPQPQMTMVEPQGLKPSMSSPATGEVLASGQVLVQPDRASEIVSNLAEKVDSLMARAESSALSAGNVSQATSATSQAATEQFARMAPAAGQMSLAGKGQLGSAGWGSALSERVMVLTAQNNQVAEIQLDPPELGSLKVRLSIGQDQVSVTFTSPHASVRDAVEQNMPRLREMMEEQGLNLGESSVSDQSDEGASDEGQSGSEFSGREGEAGSDQQEGETMIVDGKVVSLVDYYA